MSIDVAIKWLIALLNGDNASTLVVVVTVIAFFYLTNLPAFFESKKKLKIEKIEQGLKSEHVKPLTKKYLADALESEYYRLVTGIYLEPSNLREAIINLIDEQKNNISFIHFKRAMHYIKYSDNKLTVEVTNVTLFWYYASNIFSILLVVAGLTSLVSGLLLQDIAMKQIITIFSISLYFILIAMFIFYQALPVHSAKIIKNKIGKAHKELDKVHNIVFVVQHTQSDNKGVEAVKFIGAYSSIKNAELAVSRFKEIDGFSDYLDGFSIEKYPLDKDTGKVVL